MEHQARLSVGVLEVHDCIRMQMSDDSRYTGIQWIDSTGRMVAHLVVHEISNPKIVNGEAVTYRHRHGTWYTVDDAGNYHHAFDVTWGNGWEQVHMGEADLVCKTQGSGVVLRDDAGKYWRLKVTDGQLGVEPFPHDAVIKANVPA